MRLHLGPPYARDVDQMTLLGPVVYICLGDVFNYLTF
jgi:hypothetical protein